ELSPKELRKDLRLCNWPKFINRLNSVSKKSVSKGVMEKWLNIIENIKGC
ncbi:hypothetical protein MQI_00593, partial [Staphylococcus aureus subsp. aureus VRS5]